jgi:hypothetical protein
MSEVSSQVSSQLIYETLLAQNAQLARIEANQLTDRQSFKEHVVEDRTAYKRIDSLEASRNRMRGAAAVWGLVVTTITTVIGWAISLHK